MVDEQLKKRLGNIKPEPVGFPLPWKVLEVDLIYDASISVRSGFSQEPMSEPTPGLPYFVEPVHNGLDLDAYSDS